MQVLRFLVNPANLPIVDVTTVFVRVCSPSEDQNNTRCIRFQKIKGRLGNLKYWVTLNVAIISETQAPPLKNMCALQCGRFNIHYQTH